MTFDLHTKFVTDLEQEPIISALEFCLWWGKYMTSLSLDKAAIYKTQLSLASLATAFVIGALDFMRSI